MRRQAQTQYMEPPFIVGVLVVTAAILVEWCGDPDYMKKTSTPYNVVTDGECGEGPAVVQATGHS